MWLTAEREFIFMERKQISSNGTKSWTVSQYETGYQPKVEPAYALECTMKGDSLPWQNERTDNP